MCAGSKWDRDVRTFLLDSQTCAERHGHPSLRPTGFASNRYVPVRSAVAVYCTQAHIAAAWLHGRGLSQREMCASSNDGAAVVGWSIRAHEWLWVWHRIACGVSFQTCTMHRDQNRRFLL
jgi:hypothetical protein